MAQLFKNFASSTLAAAVLPTDTLLPLLIGTGALFPAIVAASGDYFYVVLYQKLPTGGEINHEVVKVTGIAGDTLTVVRAQDSTLAQAFAAGDPVELRYMAQSALDERAAAAAALAAAQAAIAAAVVPHGSQEFLANGSFTVPAGVTKIIVSGAGQGGSGGQGGYGSYFNTNSSAGVNGVNGANGTNGANSVFGANLVVFNGGYGGIGGVGGQYPSSGTSGTSGGNGCFNRHVVAVAPLSIHAVTLGGASSGGAGGGAGANTTNNIPSNGGAPFGNSSMLIEW